MRVRGYAKRIDMWYSWLWLSGCLLRRLGDTLNEFYEALTIRLGSYRGYELLVMGKSLCVLSVLFLSSTKSPKCEVREEIHTPQMLQLLHHPIMRQAINDAQEEDLIGGTVILMSCSKATVITVERKFPLRHILLHLIRHPPVTLTQWNRFLLLDTLSQFSSLPCGFNFARCPHEDASFSLRQASQIIAGIITTRLENLESFVTEIFFVAPSEIVYPNQHTVIHDLKALEKVDISFHLFKEYSSLFGAKFEMQVSSQPVQIFERCPRVLL